MIKFDKNEFLKPQIYSTLDEYESRCNVTKEIIEEIEQLQQENEQLKANWNKLKKWVRTKDILANSKINPQSIKFKDLFKHMEYLEKSDNNES